MIGKVVSICLFVLAFAYASAGSAFAQATIQHWPAFHFDNQHSGYNAQERTLCATADTGTDRANIGLVWTFPMPEADALTDSERTVDDDDPSFWSNGLWNRGGATEAFNGDFIWEDGVATATAAASEAKWFFPGFLPQGEYRVFVWYPSSPAPPGKTHTTKAVYTVFSNDGTQTFEVDQTNGGNWVEIGERGFGFAAGNNHCVSITNYAADADANPVVVCADAVMFAPTLNQAIYSSPISGIYNYQARMPNYDWVWEPAGIPVAYIGTVDSPRWATSANTDYGSVYCINSDTVQRTLNMITTWYCGKPIWKYPAPADPLDALWRDPGANLYRHRNPLEGPIEGGVYGAPVLGDPLDLDNPPDGTAETPVVYFAGMDRQIYALNANTGALIWRGPGKTLSEPTSQAPWIPIDDREDAFGATFLKIAAGTPPATGQPDTDVIIWAGPDHTKLFTGGNGRSYAIRAWLPRKLPGDPERARNATYEIDCSYTNASGTNVEDIRTVTINQDTASAAGRWVTLANSLFNPVDVRLKKTSPNSGDVTNGREIVADVVEFIPSLLGEFSYSSPALAGSGSQQLVIAGNVNGRVYALNGAPPYLSATGNPEGATTEKWVYPTVHTDRVPTSTTDDMPPWGPIVAAPAIHNEDAYIASMDGRIYRLSSILNTPTWNDTDQFPGYVTDPVTNARTLLEEKGGFSSTPAIESLPLNNAYVYAASVDGELFKLGKNLDLIWTFPGSTDASGAPLPEGSSTTVGAFRYSTPSIRGEFLYAGCSDGNIYAINKSGASWDPAWQWDFTGAGNDPQSTAQLLGGPIQSSCAVDESQLGAANYSTIFCATMNGNVWWINSNTGAMPRWAGRRIGESVFSSPGVAQVTQSDAYMYVGSDDGRLYAFSSTVNTGGWIGEDMGIPEPPGSANLQQPDPAGSVQAQIVDAGSPGSTYAQIQTDPDGTAGTNPLLNIVTTVDEDQTQDGHTIGRYLRTSQGVPGNTSEVIYEWGESINVVIWNLNKKADIESGKIEIFSSSRRGGTAVGGAGTPITPGSGGVEAGSAPQSVPFNSSNCIDYVTKDGVTKSYTTREFRIPQAWTTSSSGRPPGAGSAWVINVTMKVVGEIDPDTQKRGTGTSIITVVPELDGSGQPVSMTSTQAGASRYKQQFVSINNPLAIKADVGLAWPSSYVDPSRFDPMARVNGNGARGLVTGSTVSLTTPAIDFGLVNHGTNTDQLLLGVIDRSAMGSVGQRIDKFRIDAADLYWRGGPGAVVNPLDWDWPPTGQRGNWQDLFTGLPNAYVGSQKDYPDIRQRYESFKKLSDGGNPVTAHTRLIPAKLVNASVTPPSRECIPDPVQIYVNVPRFQPANYKPMEGYSSKMEAYLDVTNNGGFDDGNFIMGQPTAYVEPYRPFRVRVQVAPDYRIRVEESIVDLGKAPHGLGDSMGWSPFPNGPWFREFTVKNLGNVNVKNARAAKWDMYSPQSGVPLFAVNPLTGTPNILTSLDDRYDALNGIDDLPDDYGHTISKARVGDTEPTILTIPDSRRCETNLMLLGLMGLTEPMKPKVTVVAPLTQPIGTYAQQVPIMASVPPGSSNPYAYADPTFVLKVTVREDRLTDGLTEGALPQIDNPAFVPKAQAGDVQPAVFREIDKDHPTWKGNIHMFWSSDRSPDITTTPAEPRNPNEPWYMYKAKLSYDAAAGWKLGVPGIPGPSGMPGRWWSVEMDTSDLLQRLPDFTWPGAGLPGPSGNIIPNTYKHLSPSVAQDPVTGNTWLFWQAQVSIKPTAGPPVQENRVFYTKITDGTVDVTTDNTPWSFTGDFSMIKYAPRGVVYLSGGKEWLWVFYYGGDAGRWGIFYNAHADPTGAAHNPQTNPWSADTKLETPDSLTSVSEPMALRRRINGEDYLDVTYTGVSKEGQNSDVYMSRYSIIQQSASPLSVRLRRVDFPRVRDEVMSRDEKRDLYTAKHIWWRRPSLTATDTDRPTVMVEIPQSSGPPIDATDPANARLDRDRATGMHVFTYTGGDAAVKLKQMIVDAGSGTIRFGKPLPSHTKVTVSYTPRALRLAGSADSDTSSFVMLDKTPNTMLTVGSGSVSGAPGPIDRMWLFWRKPASGVRATTIFYKTMRLGVQLSKPIRTYDQNQELPSSAAFEVKNNRGPFEIDWARGRVYFTEADERYAGLPGQPVPDPLPITISYDSVGSGGITDTETFDTIFWQPELQDTALLGNAAEAMVNEGQVCAFTEPEDLVAPGGTWYGKTWPLGITMSKMWVFWASTRTGQTDLFYETLCPVFRP
ncbi:MAG: hypothetical protein Q7T82_14070 [Armatimonadota bacterium]|nr:hypothetical protein [Armatimonadota bacterium]